MNKTNNNVLTPASNRVRKSMQKLLNKQRGFGIIEIGIVLVIVGILLAVTLSYVRGVLADNRANDELKELPMVITRIQKLYNNRPNFNALTQTALISNGTFPQERITSPTVLNNRWGGAITAAVSTLTNPDDAVTLTYTRVQEAECKAIIPQIENYVRTITVNGVSVKADGAQVDLAALGTQCVAGGTTSTIVYQISK